MSKDSGGFWKDKINHKTLQNKLVNSYLCVLIHLNNSKMQNEKKTRFEVGMPVIYINDGEVIKAKVDTTSKPDDVLGSYPIVIGWEYEGNNYESETFNKDGFKCITHDAPSLFTIPEYEALQALTNSFIDGTFGAKLEAKKNAKFEPQNYERVIYCNMEGDILGMSKNAIYGNFKTDNDTYFNRIQVSNLKPVVGYEYKNGFCLQQKYNPLAQPLDIPLQVGETLEPVLISGEWSETADLLEDGKLVYFQIGQDVGSLVYGKGSVIEKGREECHLLIDFPNEGRIWHTFDGKELTGGAQTLYPIEQYNQIQLPKLKPIQVPKPKADVIGLPSWFKGGAYLASEDIYDFVNKQGIEVVNKFNQFLYSIVATVPECTFYSCNSKSLGSCTLFNALIADYVFNDVYYTMVIDTANPDSENTELLAAYNKNSKDVNEKII